MVFKKGGENLFANKYLIFIPERYFQIYKPAVTTAITSPYLSPRNPKEPIILCFIVPPSAGFLWSYLQTSFRSQGS